MNIIYVLYFIVYYNISTKMLSNNGMTKKNDRFF